MGETKAGDRLSRRIPDALEIAGAPGRGPDAHLFRAHRSAPAPVHRALAQAVCGFVSRRGRRREKGHPRLRPETEEPFQCRPAGPRAFEIFGRTTADPW